MLLCVCKNSNWILLLNCKITRSNNGCAMYKIFLPIRVNDFDVLCFMHTKNICEGFSYTCVRLKDPYAQRISVWYKTLCKHV